MNSSASSRQTFLDYAKGWLIFLVTLGHVIQVVIHGNDEFYTDPVFKAIYLFHMPLFMALAGYVAFASLNRAALGQFIRRRIVNLLLPIFCWSVLAFVALTVIHPAQNLFGAGHVFLDLFFGSLWFLWALFEASVLVALAKRYRGDNFSVALISSVLVWWLVPDFGKLYLAKFMLPFFWAGYLAAKHPELWQKISRRKIILGLAGLGSVAAFFYWSNLTYIYVSKMPFSQALAGEFLFRFAAGFLSSTVVLWIFWQLFQWSATPSLIAFGQRSLYLYILQSYFFSAYIMVIHRPLGGSVAWSLGLAPVLALGLMVGLTWISRWVEKYPLVILLFFGKSRTPAARATES
jgi:fucose 4-O-acetylase-like acetyltransferase